MDLSHPLPKLVAVDLDYTLWPCWVDTHISPPLKPTAKSNELVDRSGRKLYFFPDVPKILATLRSAGVKLAACSRTDRPDIARDALMGLQIPLRTNSTPADQQSIRAIDIFDNLQIYPGSKLAHFRALHSKLGIDFEDMLFFDDEARNEEVQKLGVCFMLVDDSVGLNWASFRTGIEYWKERRAKKA
ncbi:hypothetical protein CROQUDRAFT_651837 [Cronartium quercuum f. sp. fusiforme G11]|uniref:Magnesium-dependent phosphatase-1 n=1 Tax=Cronartium quercuum f. sp. fusiforme G11 TaxID=708437 RepID=A0A9P6TFR9_9BASI|nr:hypothetical protein CROQUDRAFT_651837 [Cronartium quercuum f. sp. fusiforme G11]